MPELPEVEVTRRGLLASLPGRRIVEVACSVHRLRCDLPHASLRRHIAGQTIMTIDRRAKYLLFPMENGAVLLAHLGMTGKFGVVSVETPLHRHDHLRLRLDDDLEVRYNDSRRFGLIAVWPAEEAAAFEETNASASTQSWRSFSVSTWNVRSMPDPDWEHCTTNVNGFGRSTDRIWQLPTTLKLFIGSMGAPFSGLLLKPCSVPSSRRMK